MTIKFTGYATSVQDEHLSGFLKNQSEKSEKYGNQLCNYFNSKIQNLKFELKVTIYF